MKANMKARKVEYIKKRLNQMREEHKKVGNMDLDNEDNFMILQTIATVYYHMSKEYFDKTLNNILAKNIPDKELINKLVSFLDSSLQANALLLAINQKLEKQLAKTKK